MRAVRHVGQFTYDRLFMPTSVFEDFKKSTTACPIPGKTLLASQAGPAAHPDWVGMSFALVLGIVGASAFVALVNASLRE